MSTTMAPPATAPRATPQRVGPPPSKPAAAVGWSGSLITAAAILAGSSALTTIISGAGWMLPLLEVVAVIVLVGGACRLVRMPTLVTLLVQLIALTVVLTSLFTTSGIGGVIPDASAVREAGNLLSGAWSQILTTVPPAPSSPELSFLIALSVGLAALLSDLLVAEAKAPALVALPLLCLYSVPASIATEMLPWYTFVAPAALYMVLLAVAGHPGRRAGLRASAGMAANGVLIAGLSVVLALFVAGSVTIVGTAGRLPRTEASSGQIGLSPFTSLVGNLKRAQPIDLLTVSGLQGDDYLRTIALQNWTPNQGFSAGALPSGGASVNGPLPGVQPAVDDSVVTVQSLNFRDRYLPILQHTTSVSGLGTSWMFSSALQTVYRSDPLNPGSYQLTQRTNRPSDVQLRKDTVTTGGPLTETGSLRTEVRDLAVQVTGGADTAYDKADALLKWFTNPANGFRYSLQVPPGNSGDRLVDFLTNKQGYCEQYASAMAVMLRSLGIPARVAIGFTQGQLRSDGSRLITSHDAHAWVEVRFDRAGWVRFDPTPLVGGQGGVQGFSNTPATPGSTTPSTDTSSQATSVAPRSNRPDGGQDRQTTVAGTVQQVAGGGSSGQSSSVLVRVLLWSVSGLVVVALIALAPGWARWLRRRRRLTAAAGGGPAGALAAWEEVEDLAIDHGIALHPAESARVAANRLARRAHLSESDREVLRELVIAAEHSWYSDQVPVVAGGAGGAGSSGSHGVAASAGSGSGHVAAVRAIRAGLVKNQPLRLIDQWFPRSLRRA